MASNRLNIQFHAHALDRLRQRLPAVKKEWLRGRLRQRIRTELRKGARVNDRGALEVEVEPGMRAVCFPSLMGGWEVKTIIKEGWEDEVEERAGYAGYKSDGKISGQESDQMTVKKCWDCPFKSDTSTNGQGGVRWTCLVTGKMLYITECVREAAGE